MDNWSIKCPLCYEKLIGKYTIRHPRVNGSQMPRWYWYCNKCKCSINKTMNKRQEEELKKQEKCV